MPVLFWGLSLSHSYLPTTVGRTMAPPLIIVASLFIFCAVAQNIGDLSLNGQGSNSTAGRLEIYYITTSSSLGVENGWGTISAANFSKSAADVACHQLGYSNAEAFFLAKNTPYGVGAGTVWLSGPNCTGSELHILRCQWSYSSCPLCPHIDDVAISCSTTQIWKNPFEGYVRLAGSSQSVGELLVYLKGLWGAVCADNFSKAEADSVCRQLGYTDSNGHQPARVSGYMWLKNLDCSGSEPCFTDCYDYPVNSSWITDCSSGPVGVSCEYSTNNIQPAGTDCQFNVFSTSVSTSVLMTTPSSTPYYIASTKPFPSFTLPPTQLPAGSENTTAIYAASSAAVLVFVVTVLVVIACLVVRKKRAHGRQRYVRLPSFRIVVDL